MITKRQIKRLVFEFSRTGNMSFSAIKSGMTRKTARKYLSADDPLDVLPPIRSWRTRSDPFNEVWAEVSHMLEEAPELESLSLFEYLQNKYPDRFQSGQLRTLQRRVKQWRALNGPPPEVFFDQERQPGMALQVDWTRMGQLAITINGRNHPHLLCHAVLPYSNWQWATRCQSESLLSLRLGLQSALAHLGRVPRELQIDNSSAATHQLHPDGSQRGFNPDFLALAAHFGLTPRTINIRCPNENGDVESSHSHLKRRIAQHLLLRGSSDFGTEADYDSFLTDILTRSNATRVGRLEEELKVMRELPDSFLPDFEEMEVRVSNRSFIRIKGVSYSVPARLIGHRVRVQVAETAVRVHAGGQLVCDMPRSPGLKPAVVDFRHVIHELVRKPGAFAGYRHREALFPGAIWRQVYDLWHAERGAERADRDYLHLLKMAADTNLKGVENALTTLLGHKVQFGLEHIRQLLPKPPEQIVDLAVPVVDLKAYDELLENPQSVKTEEVSNAA